MNLSLSLYCAVSPASWHFSGRICSWAMPGEKDSGASLRIWKIGLGRGSNRPWYLRLPVSPPDSRVRQRDGEEKEESAKQEIEDMTPSLDASWTLSLPTHFLHGIVAHCIDNAGKLQLVSVFEWLAVLAEGVVFFVP